MSAVNLNEEKVSSIIKEHYPIDGEIKIEKLDGYYDKNFLVTVGSKKYVFKATLPDEKNTSDFADTKDTIDFQHGVIKHLKKKGFPVPTIIVSKKNEEIVDVDGMLIRILTYLPGKVMLKEFLTKEKLEELGILMGKVDEALQDFSHYSQNRELIWDLKHSLKCKQYLNDIFAVERKKIAEQVLKRFEERYLPLLPILRKGVIHNDFKKENVIIDPLTKKIVGIIDYGDVVYSPYVNEIAISLAHVMFENKKSLEFVLIVLKGYRKSFPLKKEELEILPLLIATRLIKLFILASYDYKQDQNNLYIKDQIEASWRSLEYIWDSEKGDVKEEIYKEIVES